MTIKQGFDLLFAAYLMALALYSVWGAWTDRPLKRWVIWFAAACSFATYSFGVLERAAR